MLSKALGVALIFAIPGFVGYPVRLNEDVKKARSSSDAAVSVEIWPAPATMTVGARNSRWPIKETQAAKVRLIDGEYLTRELQRELRRVGCYAGDINGAWTPSTQKAIKAFTSRVNAELPTKRPDHVLLALLQSHPDKACKLPCPAGESRAAESGCVPDAIVGRAATGLPSATSSALIMSWTATVSPGEGESSDFKVPPPSLTAAPTAVRPPPAASAAPRSKPMVTSPAPPRIASTPPSKRVPSRSEVAAASRGQARTSHQSDFVRSLFQRLDDSAR
jgi:peptidoglycan hydrolase-like protein with peptidoglycan-binding domain